MIDHTIQEIVQNYIIFAGKSGQGWNTVFCEVCGDGGRTKGPRSGWMFVDEMAIFHCFNCNVGGSFDPDREYPYSRDMRTIFKAFGIPSEETDALAQKNFLTGKTAHKPERKKIDIPLLDIPDYFYPLADADEHNIFLHKAIKFLDKKSIDFASYPFYLSTGVSSQGLAETAIARSLMDRLIIPAFRNEKMIYYIARSFDDNAKMRYLNPHVPRSSVLYGMDRLYTDIEKPLFITEGFFDSHHVNGIAVLENNMTNNQIELLNKSPRKKIVIPDRKKNKSKNDEGKKLALQALELGWGISLPEYGSCSDISESIGKYGKMFILNSVSQNIVEGFPAKVALEMW